MEKSITIVCDKKDENSSMAEFLNSIITETGTYESSAVSKAEHEASLFREELSGQFTPRKLIIIGNDDAVPDKTTWHYNEFGMKYWWNENFAILQVEKKKWNERELEELLKLFKQSEADSKKNGDANGIGKTVKKIMKKVDEMPGGIKAAGAIGSIFFFGLWGATAVAAYLINGKINNDKVFENQQKYLVWKFCVTELENFMEGKK
jgi:hypothetical protein